MATLLTVVSRNCIKLTVTTFLPTRYGHLSPLKKVNMYSFNCAHFCVSSKAFSPLDNEQDNSTTVNEKSKKYFIWDTNSIREAFIDYFVTQHGHKFVPSSSVLPHNDPSLVMVNAGMNQFKPIILGKTIPHHLTGLKRVVNSQKCIRCGGKHNDLSEVGKDYRHHTFFEMLGTWSFGDYYKEQAINMAWDLLINHFNLPKDRLIVTYFGGDESLSLEADNETRDIWWSLLSKNQMSRDKLIALGAEDNFWEMGTTGPCGPCSEIHFIIDEKEHASSSDPLAGSLELWNLVFMQYERLSSGHLTPLPRRHVDTGMGLERLASVMLTEKQNSNYDTDLFTPLIEAIQNHVPNAPAYSGSLDSPVDYAYRLLSDHARMYTIAISDGIVPSTAGPGHKVRYVIRSAYFTAYSVFVHQPRLLLVKLVDEVIKSLGYAFPNLLKQEEFIKITVHKECELFYNKLRKARREFKKHVQQLKEGTDSSEKRIIVSGAFAFQLVKKFGAPKELLMNLEKEHSVEIDWPSFESIVQREHQLSLEGASKDQEEEEEGEEKEEKKKEV